MGFGLTSKASLFKTIPLFSEQPRSNALGLLQPNSRKVGELSISLPIVQNAVRGLVYPQSL